MSRILQLGGILLLAVGVSYGFNDHTQAKDPPPKPPAKPLNKAGLPKGQIPPGAARLVNPASIAARLYRMSPEEREHALEKLPNEEARERARKQLQWFDSLPKEQQEMQLRRMDNFAKLPPERQAEVRGLIAEANALPGPRATAVRQALYRLQQANDQQRENIMRSPAFQQRFSPEEQRIIRGLADAWMGPAY